MFNTQFIVTVLRLVHFELPSAVLLHSVFHNVQ